MMQKLRYFHPNLDHIVLMIIKRKDAEKKDACKYIGKIAQLLDSLHALLEYRVTPGFADDDISPLHYYNTDEEGCVACELHNLPLLVCLRARETDRQ